MTWIFNLNICSLNSSVFTTSAFIYCSFQGQRLFEKLLELASRNIEIKLVSDILPVESKVLNDLKSKGKTNVFMLLCHWLLCNIYFTLNADPGDVYKVQTIVE